MADEAHEAAKSTRRRPARRVAESAVNTENACITPDHQGIAAAYGNTLLFVGYEVNGLIEIVVYPRYRFSSDDRVQGHLGFVNVAPGTAWSTLLSQVDIIFDAAQVNYRTAVALRAREQRADGAQFEAAYEAITDIFRESWHGFALRLGREGRIEKNDVRFTGDRHGPVLVDWGNEQYTLMVFPTGSITLVKGDRRSLFRKAD